MARASSQTKVAVGGSAGNPREERHCCTEAAGRTWVRARSPAPRQGGQGGRRRAGCRAGRSEGYQGEEPELRSMKGRLLLAIYYFRSMGGKLASAQSARLARPTRRRESSERREWRARDDMREGHQPRGAPSPTEPTFRERSTSPIAPLKKGGHPI